MKSRIRLYLLIVFTNILFFEGHGQNTNSTATVPIFTADSLASGNYKDVLSSFYQLSINNLTGPNKELKFTSNPYAIMLRGDSTLKHYNQYMRYRFWRTLNFNIDAKLDSAYHFKGFAAGLTIALVNRRDYSIRNDFIGEANKLSNDTMIARFFVVIGSLINDRSTFLIFDTLARKYATDNLTSTKIELPGKFGSAFEKYEKQFIE
ncbi:MAG TPA: hypothetical protein VKT28_10560, partial [Puia sp.]|nr:hypothetical protein [Puia sp.]